MTRFILIHGSWHAGWCWHRPQTRLIERGYRACAPDMPAHGKDRRPVRGLTLGDYAEVVTSILDKAAEPCVLVAHSRGGVVASLAAELRPDKVQALVYVAAFMVPPGERVLEWAQTDDQSLVRKHLDIDEAGGFDMLRAEAFREALYHDCREDDVALCRALLTPEPLGPTLTPLAITPERWGRIKRGYVLLTEDRAVGPDLQRRFLERTPCDAVVELAASHSAYFSRPDELSDAIVRCGLA